MKLEDLIHINEEMKNRIFARKKLIEINDRKARHQRFIEFGATIEPVIQFQKRTEEDISIEEAKKYAQDLVIKLRNVRDNKNEIEARKFLDDLFILLRDSSKINKNIHD